MRRTLARPSLVNKFVFYRNPVSGKRLAISGQIGLREPNSALFCGSDRPGFFGPLIGIVNVREKAPSQCVDGKWFFKVRMQDNTNNVCFEKGAFN